MAAAAAVRYTGSGLDVVLAVVLLGVAAIHAAAGVPTAVLPAVGGVVLLGAALALAPVTRHRIRQNGSTRGDLLVFGGALAVAALAVGGFVLVGRVL